MRLIDNSVGRPTFGPPCIFWNGAHSQS